MIIKIKTPVNKTGVCCKLHLLNDFTFELSRQNKKTIFTLLKIKGIKGYSTAFIR